MQFITGRIILIGELVVINKDNNQFSSITFVIKKKMNKKMRNISFKCYGKLADEINALRINDKLKVEYLIISNKATTEKWYTTLQAKSIEQIGNVNNIEKQKKLI